MKKSELKLQRQLHRPQHADPLERVGEKVKTPMESPLDELEACAIEVDRTPVKGRQMIAAIGVAHNEGKTVLGMQGATENATVVRAMLQDLARRGLIFSARRLYVLNGMKALSASEKRHAREVAVAQRCKILKRRNVLDPLPEEYLQRSLSRVLFVSLNSCQPSTEFTSVPALTQGGRERVDPISGRVRNARREQQIVIYTHSGPWWAQPRRPYLGS
jgi:transposase-like protein